MEGGRDHSLPPLFRLLPEAAGEPMDLDATFCVSVKLDPSQPLPPDAWLKSGDVGHLVGQLKGLGRPASEHPWVSKLEVSDPDPPPSLEDILLEWAGSAGRGTIGTPRLRRCFVHEKIGSVPGLYELLAAAVASRAHPPRGPSSNKLSESLKQAKSKWQSGNGNDPLTLALLAFYDLCFEDKQLGEEEEQRLSKGLTDILMGVPGSQLYSGMDSLVSLARLPRARTIADSVFDSKWAFELPRIQRNQASELQAATIKKRKAAALEDEGPEEDDQTEIHEEGKDAEMEGGPEEMIAPEIEGDGEGLPSQLALGRTDGTENGNFVPRTPPFPKSVALAADDAFEQEDAMSEATEETSDLVMGNGELPKAQVEAELLVTESGPVGGEEHEEASEE